jgi:hypothetical protein
MSDPLSTLITMLRSPVFARSFEGTTPVPAVVSPGMTRVTIPKQHDGVTSSAVFTLTATEAIYYRTKVMWSPRGSLVSLNASEGQLEAGESVNVTLTVTSPSGVFNRTNHGYNIGIFADGYNGKYPYFNFIQVEEK